MVTNHHAASSTDRPTVSRPWLAGMVALGAERRGDAVPRPGRTPRRCRSNTTWSPWKAQASWVSGSSGRRSADQALPNTEWLWRRRSRPAGRRGSVGG